MKAEIKTYIVNMIEGKLRDMNGTIRSNKWQINKLAKDTATLKRSRYELTKIIKQVKYGKE